MWRAAVALTALVLGAPAIACGDEDDGGSGDEALSDERQEYVDAIVAVPNNQGVAAETWSVTPGLSSTPWASMRSTRRRSRRRT
jgi:hypothetical protein